MYTHQPKTRDELIKITRNFIDNGDYNLNIIDTSLITDMSYLFKDSKFKYADVAYWNTSNVRCMDSMFENSLFDGHISFWDVSNVESMVSMFRESEFNQDISLWNTSKVKDMSVMFKDSKFNQDISMWDVSKLEYASFMFSGSQFSGDISSWKINKGNLNVKYMFTKSPLQINNPF